MNASRHFICHFSTITHDILRRTHIIRRSLLMDDCRPIQRDRQQAVRRVRDERMANGCGIIAFRPLDVVYFRLALPRLCQRGSMDMAVGFWCRGIFLRRLVPVQ